LPRGAERVEPPVLLVGLEHAAVLTDQIHLVRCLDPLDLLDRADRRAIGERVAASRQRQERGKDEHQLLRALHALLNVRPRRKICLHSSVCKGPSLAALFGRSCVGSRAMKRILIGSLVLAMSATAYAKRVPYPDPDVGGPYAEPPYVPAV